MPLTRGHAYKLHIKCDGVLAFVVTFFFANRVVNVWNVLPLTVLCVVLKDPWPRLILVFISHLPLVLVLQGNMSASY